MITIKEEVKFNYFDVREYFFGFPEDFEEYIKVFKITMSIDFEIQLKKKYLNNNEIKNKILKYLKSQYSNIEVCFVNT